MTWFPSRVAPAFIRFLVDKWINKETTDLNSNKPESILIKPASSFLFLESKSYDT